jgi:hypothetical protein
MKKSKKVMALSLLSLGAITLSGCGANKSNIPYSFSVALQSGASVLEIGAKEKLVPYDNGEDTSGRDKFSYGSTNTKVATIDASGNITANAEGRVNFWALEKKSNKKKYLKKEVLVVKKSTAATGGYNFAGGTKADELAERAKILGKLEKYAMDTHLTGITLFDNGGYVKYSDRVTIPTLNGKTYIQGFGFGVLSDGEITGNLPAKEGSSGTKYKSLYHSSISQDSLKINMYSATGSQVSDLAGYISSSYWGTRMAASKADYEWYPLLASNEVYKPARDLDGKLTSVYDDESLEAHKMKYTLEASKKANNDPFPLEDTNSSGLYRKWRIYVKVDSVATPLKYSKYKQNTANISGDGVADPAWNGRSVVLDDYLFAYKLLLTGSNNLIRGSEMANDTSYGIKGAQRYFSETQSIKIDKDINAKWKNYIDTDKLGLAKGVDAQGQSYIDIELNNPIDEFTAKYTLSSNLVSPLPEEFFIGANSVGKAKYNADETKSASFNESAAAYGTFNQGKDNAILNNTICLGPYTLTKWVKNSEIVFATNNGNSEINTGVKWYEADEGRYKINGVYYRIIDTSTDTEKNWKEFNDHNLDSAGVPTSKVKQEKGKALATKGDATFKLNVNSCTQEEWNKLFGPNGKIAQNQKWTVKPWMSNPEFLDGLFYSIDRKSFADKRGVTPSVNYFSDAYQMRNSEGGTSYNEYTDPNTGVNYHEEAVKGYSENFGYNKDKAIDCFRNAVQQLAKQKKIVLGTKQKPTEINIHIRWMYQTDIKEYGDDIKSYFESAFNNDAVCGGRVKLVVKQDAVQNWEDVYNVWMMKGRFDLGFGAISGNTYNPLNFLEVLKSDNSSGFTLNWGPDTSKVDEKNPIVYDDGTGSRKWSFDSLWTVADHGGIVEKGESIKPVKSCTAQRPTKLDGTALVRDDAEKWPLYDGFKIELNVNFAESSSAKFDASRFDVYVFGYGNVTLAENTHNPATSKINYDKANKKIVVEVSAEKADEVNEAIKKANGWTAGGYTGNDKWQNNPFVLDARDSKFAWELYYELTIGGTTSINYAEVK